MIDLAEQMTLWLLLGLQRVGGQHLSFSGPEWGRYLIIAALLLSFLGGCYLLGDRSLLGALLALAVVVGLALPGAWCFPAESLPWTLALSLAPTALALAAGAHPSGWLRMAARLLWPGALLGAAALAPEISPGLLSGSLLAWTVGWGGRAARPFGEVGRHGAL